MMFSVSFQTVSCSKLNCPSKKRCLLDQNMIPHCVNCTQRKCGGNNSHAWTNSIHMNSTLIDKEEFASANIASLDKSICGSDGLTYPSMCDLRQAACLRGKAIPVAYKGPCRSTCKEEMFLHIFPFRNKLKSKEDANTITSLNAVAAVVTTLPLSSPPVIYGFMG